MPERSFKQSITGTSYSPLFDRKLEALASRPNERLRRLVDGGDSHHDTMSISDNMYASKLAR